ncbi:MAG TPA: YfiR family protein [Burkholderiales bacterium]|nr:YfiR family protein [Burkholderiales bacterium]
MQSADVQMKSGSVGRAIPTLVVVAICAAMHFFLVPTPSIAQDSPQALAQQVKAAYLFKFGGYVEWPSSAFAEPASPLLIGVYGDDQLAREVTRVVLNRTVNGRSVVVQSLRVNDAIPKVHILFVTGSLLSRLPELGAAAHSALIVTDSEKALDQGSVINFVTADNRVRFEVSLDAAKRSGLKIGAPLLSVAMRVQG